MVTIGFMTSNLRDSYAGAVWIEVMKAAKKFDVNLVVFDGGPIFLRSSELYKDYAAWYSIRQQSNYGYQDNVIYSYINGQVVDGLIMATGALAIDLKKDEMQAICDKMKPLPMISLSYEMNVPSVLVDNKPGIVDIVNHLIVEHGVRRIAFIKGLENNEEAEIRYAGYVEAMEANGLEVYPDYVYQGNFMYRDGYNSIAELLDVRGVKPEAIVCANDSMATGVLAALKERGIRVPDDVLVTGFDDCDRAKYAETPLTSVKQPLEKQAEKAMEMLLGMLNGEQVSMVEYLPTEVVYRDSCGCSSRSSETVAELGERIISMNDSNHVLMAISQNFIACNSMGQLVDIAEGQLPRLGINSAFIATYEREWKHSFVDTYKLPGTMDLKMFFNGEQKKREGKVDLQDGELVKSAFCGKTRVLILEALYFAEDQMGVVGVGVEKPEGMIYEFLKFQISNAFKGTVLIEENNREKNAALDVAIKDELTGLYNRRGFMTVGADRFNKEIKAGRHCMIMFADLDGLKKINDTYGHDEGDFAIQKAADILAGVLRENDVLSRLGGDEFIGLITAPIDKEDLIRERLNQKIESINQVIDKPYRIDMSIGFSEYKPGEEMESLMEMADTKLYLEKKKKKGAQN